MYIFKLAVQLMSQLSLFIRWPVVLLHTADSWLILCQVVDVNRGSYSLLMFFELDASLVIHTLLLKRTIIECAHMKISCKFNETIFENLEDHEKRFSFIFHLFVKLLINISDVWLATGLKLC